MQTVENDTKVLQNKLEIVKSIYCVKYMHILTIRTLYDEGKIDLLKMKWADGFKNDYNPKDLKKDSDWRTHEDCTNVKITPTEVIIDLWDGDSFSGDKTKVRWTAQFSPIPQAELIRFETSINNAFDRHCAELHEDELKTAKEKRIKAIAKNLLK